MTKLFSTPYLVVSKEIYHARFRTLAKGGSLLNLFDHTIQTLEKSLAYSSAKNRTIANNIANVDTPNFKAEKVEFKNVLTDVVNGKIENKRTHSKHFSFQENVDQPYVIKRNKNTMYNHNGNNVDVDQEMAELAKNQIYYQAVVDRLNGKFSNIEKVLRGGN